MNNIFETEQAVLGSIFAIGDPSSDSIGKATSLLKPASFANNTHQKIYKSMLKMIAKGQWLDSISLESQMQQDGTAEQETYAYASQLKQAGNSSNIMGYAHMVRHAAIERMAESKLQECLALLNDPTSGDIYQRLGLIESQIGDIQNRAMKSTKGGLVHVREIADKWVEDWELRDSNPELMRGYSSGINKLDELFGPKLIRKGSLGVIGARPKMGKTALLNMITCHFALEHKKAVAMFSLEMPSDQIFERMLSERAKVNPNIFYKQQSEMTLSPNYDTDCARTTAAIGHFLESELYIDDSTAITIEHVQRESRSLAKKNDIGLICIDYLTLMEAGKADRNDLAYGDITKKLKNLAKELDCVVLLLTQLNRGLESRSDKRPMPSDSRDTGQIEQDCDWWIGLYREAVYNDNISPEESGITEALMRLNRHGETGTAMLNLRNGYFEEYFGQGITTGKGNYNDDY